VLIYKINGNIVYFIWQLTIVV